MTRVDQIEKEIERLSREEQNALRDWFLAFDAEMWDTFADNASPYIFNRPGLQYIYDNENCKTHHNNIRKKHL